MSKRFGPSIALALRKGARVVKCCAEFQGEAEARSARELIGTLEMG